MDRNEAMKLLSEIKHYLTAGNPVWRKEVVAEALDKAIEALTQESTQDLISRSRAIDACLIGWNKGYVEILADIKALPSADAVEVVRCRDCKWYDKGENEVDAWSICIRTYGIKDDVSESDYCSWGERREDGEV